MLNVCKCVTGFHCVSVCLCKCGLQSGIVTFTLPDPVATAGGLADDYVITVTERKKSVMFFGCVFFLISFGSPHVRCTPMGRTCGEPNEIELTAIRVILNGSCEQVTASTVVRTHSCPDNEYLQHGVQDPAGTAVEVDNTCVACAAGEYSRGRNADTACEAYVALYVAAPYCNNKSGVCVCARALGRHSVRKNPCFVGLTTAARGRGSSGRAYLQRQGTHSSALCCIDV